MNIFILSGGFGTRLQSVVNDVPKPMAPILNKPFLDYQIKEIRKYFPNNMIYLLTYYLSEVIEEYYKTDKLISVIKENTPLGTGGSVKCAIDKLGLKTDSTLLIFNGDTYLKLNLTNLITDSHHEITIVSSFQNNCSRYGTLTIDKNNQITKFNEKVNESKNNYINAGCYLFKNLTFFDDMAYVQCSIEDKFKKYLDKQGKMYIYQYKDIFIDIGIPEDYNKMINFVGGISE